MSWLLEKAGLAALLGLIALCAITIWLIIYLYTKERRNEAAQNTYNNLRAGSWITISTLVLGIIASLAVAVALMVGIDYLLAAAMRNPHVIAHTFWVRQLTGAIIGFPLAFLVVFWPGVFAVPPGQKAFLKIFGIPFGRLGAGYGWILRGLMEVVFVSTQAHEESTENWQDKPEEYVTLNGIEMFMRAGSISVTQDPLLVQGIVGGEVREYIASVRRSALRRYIAEKRVSMSILRDDQTDLKGMETFFNQLKEMKGEIAAGGPETVRKYMNEQLQAYGLYCTQVQFEEILFNDTLEQKSQRFFDEMVESLGLIQDATNKANVIKELNTRSLADVGLKLDELTKADKLELLRRGIGFSLAAEGQGNYNFVDFGGQPPTGVMVNASGTAMPPPANKP